MTENTRLIFFRLELVGGVGLVRLVGSVGSKKIFRLVRRLITMFLLRFLHLFHAAQRISFRHLDTLTSCYGAGSFLFAHAFHATLQNRHLHMHRLLMLRHWNFTCARAQTHRQTIDVSHRFPLICKRTHTHIHTHISLHAIDAPLTLAHQCHAVLLEPLP